MHQGGIITLLHRNRKAIATRTTPGPAYFQKVRLLDRMARRKADTPSLDASEVLEPASDAQLRKARRRELMSAPRVLTFPDQLQASTIAQLAAGRCGFDEGELAALQMTRPLMAATHVFDFVQKPGYLRAEGSCSRKV